MLRLCLVTVEHRGFLAALRQVVVRNAWDTAQRNRMAAKAATRLSTSGLVLDIGCGADGLAAYLPDRVIALDIHSTGVQGPQLFVRGSAIALPVRTSAVSVATCVDVLEHIAPDCRELVIQEAMRVSGVGLVLGFPSGHDARQSDAWLFEALQRRQRPVPDWLVEHLAQPSHPDARDVEAILRHSGYVVRSTFSEPFTVHRLLRRAYCLSTSLYVVFNLAAGLLLGRATGARSGYRVVLEAAIHT